MPDVDSVTQAQGAGYTGRSVSGTGNASLSIEEFYKLLAAQLKYQDADNPMDTSEMMAQMVQTQMISTINQMNQISLITYSASMIGQEVTVAELDPKTGMATGEVTTGVVTGASIYGDTPMIYLEGGRYAVSQVLLLGKTGIEEPEDPDGPKDPEDPEGPKDPEDPEGPKDPEDPDGSKEPEDPDGVKDPEDPEGPKDPEDGSGDGGPEEVPGTGGTEEIPGTGGTEETGNVDGTGGTPGTGGTGSDDEET